ncbi:MAG: hypothetical protein JJ953_03365 [Gracilimonas sp.]|uniref:asparagine synthase-related protein n=1 Tax=Gracilimonas sp. TaxID=1974203 RepID=UPI001B1CBE4E|nr:asparagine synthase-related protein [Gracilimonas sp.]MBO6585125.1 hypothetical protein [Gracilimonas sp.]MBO6615603.1 hypothetical protein [Gracilimonas sp.]
MGWFIGIAGRNQSLKNSILSLTSSNDFNVESESFFLLAGGHHQTTHYQLDEDQKAGWVASGIGISTCEEPKLYDLDDWDQAIGKGVNHLHQINGHFSVCRWNDQTAELITDQLGIRNVFIHPANDFVLFSTRLDWIKKLIPHTTIDWEKFGSRWLAINQFSNGSFIQGVERISQGGHATITPEGVSVSNQRWNYNQREVGPQSFMNALSNFSTLPLKHGQPLSLGLSGGLDSRTLFAILLQQSNSNWTTHTFGEASHPDLKTATLLNGFYNKEHYVFEERIPEAKEIEDLLPDFIGQTMLTSTPSHFVGFQAYKKIQDLGFSVIDGGFGEIARRRFMNNILLRSKTALLKKDISALIPFLRLDRSDIFTEECNNSMISGLGEELEEEIDAMPDITEIGIENWLDLFTVRTRVPNAAGPEQARSDNELLNYMPFLQPDLIELALSLPVKDRKNARIFRTFIKRNTPKLQSAPLIKGDYSYPYWMKDYTSAIWMRLKQKFGMKYESPQTIDFLMTMEEYIRDLHNSKSAKEFSAYDHRKIDQLITGFYDNKNNDLAHQLNWWLAFEVFRQI